MVFPSRASILFTAALFLAPAFALAANGAQSGDEPTIPESAWTPGIGAPVTPPAETPHGRSIAVFDPVGIGVDPNVCTVFGDLVRVELMKAGNSVTARSMMPPAATKNLLLSLVMQRCVPRRLITPPFLLPKRTKRDASNSGRAAAAGNSSLTIACTIAVKPGNA